MHYSYSILLEKLIPIHKNHRKRTELGFHDTLKYSTPNGAFIRMI